MTSKIWITKRSMVYSTQKLAKRGVYPLWAPFTLTMGRLVFPFGPTVSIAKVWTDVRENFWQNRRRKSGSPKDPWTYSTRKLVK
ncbi:hypothetical protein H5410_056497 [Solanum commersonii]|uniref:Uncharacterized protein n=1 Tax=Solanum commersonii TaxID=4109 RepID=A0A9J5WKF4_SOLCO|nr:hypothetical protein H5410_056497 [Solanum commersonii]